MNYFFKKLNIIFLGIFLIPFSASICLAKQISKDFTVQTRIERNEFFTSTISAKFIDPVLYPAYDEESDTLSSVHSELVVTATNVVEADAAVRHLLTLHENQTQCFEQSEDPDDTQSSQGLVLIPTDTGNYGKEFVRIFVDGSTSDDELSKTQSLSFPFDEDAETQEDELTASHDVLLNFGQIPVNAVRCEGDISLLVEFDL